MMTCTGWLFLRGCSTSSPWRSIVVFSTGLHDISSTTVCLCLKFLVARIYDLSDVINCLFHEFTAACLEAVLFLLLN